MRTLPFRGLAIQKRHARIVHLLQQGAASLARSGPSDFSYALGREQREFRPALNATKRHRSHIGRVGLGKQAIGRDHRRRRAQIVASLEGDRAAECHMRPTLDPARKLIGAHAAAMQQRAGFRPALFFKNTECIFVRIPHVKHERQARNMGQLHLTTEYVLLNIARRQIVMIVEPDLAQGGGTRIGQTLKQGRFHSGIPLACDMRMNSACDAHARYGRLGAPAQIACAFINSH